jgi:TPR repeat protein
MEMENKMATFLFYCGTMYTRLSLYPMARYAFSVSAQFGHIESMRELGLLLVQGKGGEVDIYEGSRYLHVAENAGDENAALALDMLLDF